MEYTLSGNSDITKRIDLLTNYIKLSEEKVNHLGSYRQKNLSIALIIFAGLFSYGSQMSSSSSQILVSSILLSIMIAFCLWDRRFHRYCHGWANTRKILTARLIDILNDKENSVSFTRYDKKSEAEAEWFSLQPILFYFLIIGSGISFFIFPYI